MVILAFALGNAIRNFPGSIQQPRGPSWAHGPLPGDSSGEGPKPLAKHSLQQYSSLRNSKHVPLTLDSKATHTPGWWITAMLYRPAEGDRISWRGRWMRMCRTVPVPEPRTSRNAWVRRTRSSTRADRDLDPLNVGY